MADIDEQDEEEILLQPGELFDGRYRIMGILGRGGIGVVYQAEDTENHIRVALKVLLPDWAGDRKMVARFLREARLAIRVQHSSIVQILASGKSKKEGAPYLVMEFIEGKTLFEYLQSFLKRGQKLGVAAAQPIMRQLSSVLAACHARGVVHRDLKPANIMLIDDSETIGGKRIKLLDFGIAKMFSEENQSGAQTSVGDRQPGTPAYMAPEQCMGTLGPDADPAKMDVYAAGVIFYQLLSGKLPLWSSNKMGMMAMALTVEPDPLLKVEPTLPTELAQLVDSMLLKDPKLRPTMDQVRELLKSRQEVVTMRPTMEIDALVPAPQTDGSSIAPTADASDAPQTPTLPPGVVSPARSLGDRSTQPRPAGNSEEVLSSAARGTGQQLSSAETKARRRQRRGLAIGAGVLVLALLSGAGVWRLLVSPPRPQPAVSIPPPSKLPPSSSTELAPPATSAAPISAVATSATPPQTTETKEDSAKNTSKKQLEPTPAKKCTPTTACISGTVSDSDKTAILDALDEAKINPCSGSLILTASPVPTVRTAKGVKPDRQYQFQMALRGAAKPIKFPGEAAVKCAKR